MKNPKFSLSAKQIADVFAFPKLFTLPADSDVISPDSNQEIKHQMMLLRISTLLHLKDYMALLEPEFSEFSNFISPYINVSIMLETPDELELNSFLININKLIELYDSFDEDFYDQHMGRLIKIMKKSSIKIIDFFAAIANGQGLPSKALWSARQLQQIDNLLYFIAKFTYANKIN